MTDKETMKRALDALNKLTDVFLDTEGSYGDYETNAIDQGYEAITAIKEALAQPEQEPCGWQFLQDGKWHNGTDVNDHRANTIAAGFPVRDVYTTPPAAQRKPLTDEEILASNYPDGEENGPTVSAPDFDLLCFARQIEAAHGIGEKA